MIRRSFSLQSRFVGMSALSFCLCVMLFVGSASSQSDLDDFDEIDRMLDAQFEDTDAMLEKRFELVAEAIDKAYKGLTKKIEVKWEDDAQIPTQSKWVNYTQDLNTRTILDYEKGVMIIETIVPESSSPEARLEQLLTTAQQAANLTKKDMAEQDLFQKEVEKELTSQGIEFEDEAANASAERFIALLLPENQSSSLLTDDFLTNALAQISSPEPEQQKPAQQESSQERPDQTLTAQLSSEPSPQDTELAQQHATPAPVKEKVAEESTIKEEIAVAEVAVAEANDKTSEANNTDISNIEVNQVVQKPAEEKIQPEKHRQEETASKPVTRTSDSDDAVELPDESDSVEVTETNTQLAKTSHPKDHISATQSPKITSNKANIAKANTTEQTQATYLSLPQQVPREMTKSSPPTFSRDVSKYQDSPKVVLKTENGVTKLQLSIEFVNNFQKILLEQNLHTITRFSEEYKIPVSTLLAIIETESSYNPRARSPIPAFGLMQLVPKTAGIDAYNFVYGEKKVVAPDYLYIEENNLELGAAYFHILMNRYLKGVTNLQSRFYCAVASYNTGIGNVAKTFSGSKRIRSAVPVINAMEPDEVLAFLLENLAATETKNYLKKIIRRQDKYAHMDTET